MNLSDFYNEVARRADTPKTQINVAEVKRVLSVAFQVLNEQAAPLVVELLGKGLAAAAKKKA